MFCGHFTQLFQKLMYFCNAETNEYHETICTRHEPCRPLIKFGRYLPVIYPIFTRYLPYKG